LQNGLVVPRAGFVIGRFLAESSFTNKTAVANISSPSMACSGCVTNKQTNRKLS